MTDIHRNSLLFAPQNERVKVEFSRSNTSVRTLRTSSHRVLEFLGICVSSGWEWTRMLEIFSSGKILLKARICHVTIRTVCPIPAWQEDSLWKFPFCCHFLKKSLWKCYKKDHKILISKSQMIWHKFCLRLPLTVYYYDLLSENFSIRAFYFLL